MPWHTQQEIFVGFVFKEFLNTYKNTFEFPNYDRYHQPARYSWHDYTYQKFMLKLLKILEPRQAFLREIIYEELDEVSEMLFFNRGNVDIGFEINHQKKFVLRLSNSIIIGAYNMSFSKRTKFIYMAKTYCSGYSIRRSYWLELMQEDDFKGLIANLKQSFLQYYEKKYFPS